MITRLVAATLSLLFVFSAHATDVSFVGAVSGAGGDAQDVKIRVRLVDADGRQVQAARTTDARPVATDAIYSYAAATGTWTSSTGADLGADPLILDLAAQSTLARPDAAATYWRWDISTANVIETYTVQIADSGSTVPWLDWVGAAAVDPADLTAGRVLTAAERAALDAATAPPTGDNRILTAADALAAGLPEAPEDGTIYGRQDSTWVEVTAVEADPLFTAEDTLGEINTRLGTSLADGPHTIDTSAATLCTGTDTYLDGEGNCDTLSTGGASALDDLTDVSAASPSDGDILVYRDGSAAYVLEAKPAASSNPACADITDSTTAGCAVVTAADAAAQRAALDVDQAGSDNSTPATVADTATVDLSLVGQQISADVLSVPESAVTAHEAALSIAEAQINDLGAYITAAEAAAAAPVQSVAGRTGAVVLSPGDVGAQPAGLVAAPSAPTDTCTAGQRAWGSPYLYTCIAANTWVRLTPERTW